MWTALLALTMQTAPVVEAKPIWRDIQRGMTEADVEAKLGKVWKKSPQAYLREHKVACYRLPDNVWCGYLKFDGPGGTVSRVDVNARKTETDANADNVEAGLTAKYGTPISRDSARIVGGQPQVAFTRTTVKWRSDGMTVQLQRMDETRSWDLIYIIEGAVALPL